MRLPAQRSPGSFPNLADRLGPGQGRATGYGAESVPVAATRAVSGMRPRSGTVEATVTTRFPTILSTMAALHPFLSSEALTRALGRDLASEHGAPFRASAVPAQIRRQIEHQLTEIAPAWLIVTAFSAAGLIYLIDSLHRLPFPYWIFAPVFAVIGLFWLDYNRSLHRHVRAQLATYEELLSSYVPPPCACLAPAPHTALAPQAPGRANRYLAPTAP